LSAAIDTVSGSGPVANTVEQLVDQYGLVLCVECGKCVAVCPMAEIFEDFDYDVSPRGLIERALLGLEMMDGVGIWFCLACDLCTSLCPAGVQLRDFIEATRKLAIQAGRAEYCVFCRECGEHLWPRHTAEYVEQVLGEEPDKLLGLCPRCRRNAVGKKIKSLLPGSKQLPKRVIQGDGVR
jgi:heterodisulfide reductase subunit C